MSSKNYINPKKFKILLIKAQKENKISEELGKLFKILSEHILKKSSWYRYPHDMKQDMQSEAIITCIKAIKSFNPNKNCFGYYTEIILNSYKYYSKKYYKEKNFKMEIIKNEYHKNNKPFTDEIKKDISSLNKRQEKKENKIYFDKI